MFFNRGKHTLFKFNLFIYLFIHSFIHLFIIIIIIIIIIIVIIVFGYSSFIYSIECI